MIVTPVIPIRRSSKATAPIQNRLLQLQRFSKCKNKNNDKEKHRKSTQGSDRKMHILVVSHNFIHFTLKAVFVLKIFKFQSSLFGHV